MDVQAFRRLPFGLQQDVRRWLEKEKWWTVLYLTEDRPGEVLADYLSRDPWKDLADTFAFDTRSRQRDEQVAACHECTQIREGPCLCNKCGQPVPVNGRSVRPFRFRLEPEYKQCKCGYFPWRKQWECDKHVLNNW